MNMAEHVGQPEERSEGVTDAVHRPRIKLRREELANRGTLDQKKMAVARHNTAASVLRRAAVDGSDMTGIYD